MSNVLAAIDFSDVTPRVLEHAALLARGLDAHLWLVHAAAPDPDFVGYDAGPQVVRDQVAAELREEHRGLQKEADRLRETGLEVTALLLQGPTVETVLAEAERVKAELLVVGTHGHGALHHLLMGSVSQGLIKRAPCPVVIVPSPKLG